MKDSLRLIYVDFDPISDDLGNRGGLLTDEQVIQKCKEVFDDIFAPNDPCIIAFGFSFKVARKKIRKGNEFLNCINNIDYKKIKFVNSYIVHKWRRLVFRSYYKEAIFKTQIKEIDIQQVFRLQLTAPNYLDRVLVLSSNEEIFIELSINQWGFRRLILRLNNSELIQTSFLKYSQWAEKDRCKVEMDVLTEESIMSWKR